MKSPTFITARPRQRGATAVEYALVITILFGFVFGSMETARALYLWSTLAEVVSRAARAAAVSSPSDEAQVRHNAVFPTAGTSLPLGGGINETYLRIDYLNSDRLEIGSPPSPVQNAVNCTRSPTDADCVRFVRARLCLPSTACTRVPYKPMVGLDFLSAFNINLPTFSTTVAVDTLGLTPAP